MPSGDCSKLIYETTINSIFDSVINVSLLYLFIQGFVKPGKDVG